MSNPTCKIMLAECIKSGQVSAAQIEKHRVLNATIAQPVQQAPVRQPLTDAEIGAIHVACGTPRALHIEFARAIEAAHCIAQPKAKP